MLVVCKSGNGTSAIGLSRTSALPRLRARRLMSIFSARSAVGLLSPRVAVNGLVVVLNGVEGLNVDGERDVVGSGVLAIPAQIAVPARRRPADRIARRVVRAPGIGVEGEHIGPGSGDEVAQLRVANLASVVVHVKNCVGEVVADGIEPVHSAGSRGGVVQVPLVTQLESDELAQVRAFRPERRDLGLIARPTRPGESGRSAHQRRVGIPQPVDRGVISVRVGIQVKNVVPGDHCLRLQAAIDQDPVPLADLSVTRLGVARHQQRGGQRHNRAALAISP